MKRREELFAFLLVLTIGLACGFARLNMAEAGMVSYIPESNVDYPNYSSTYLPHVNNTTSAHSLNKYQLVCTVNGKTNYTFTGTEPRNGGYGVNTATGDKTINIDPDLFPTGTEFSLCKSTSDANTVTLDSGAGNTIDGSQTYVLSTYNQVVTIIRSAANTWKVKSGFLENSAAFNSHTGNTTTAHGVNTKANLAGGNTYTGTQIFQRITTAGLYPTYLYGRPLSAKCRFNGTTTISTGVWWTVRLNDSGAAHTDDFLTHLNISSINRTLDYFRAPVTGWYYINAYYNFAANATGQRIININIDTTDPSTVYIREVKNNAGGSYETAGQTGRYLLYLNEGQKARVHHMHNAGTSIGDSYANIEISYAGP